MLGERLAYLRYVRGMSRQELEQQTGVDSSDISQAEEHNAPLSQGQILSICSALQCSIDYLVLGLGQRRLQQHNEKEELQFLGACCQLPQRIESPE